MAGHLTTSSRAPATSSASTTCFAAWTRWRRRQPAEPFGSRRIAELLRSGLDLRDRHAAGEISRHGLAVARGRMENQLSDLVFPPKTSAANERLAQHLWAHRDDLFTFLRQPGVDAANWRAEGDPLRGHPAQG